MPLASGQRWTRDGTTGQQPDPKRQRTSPVAALATNGSSVEALLDEARDIWIPCTIFAFADGKYDLRTPTGTTMSGVAADKVRLAIGPVTYSMRRDCRVAVETPSTQPSTDDQVVYW